MYLRDKINIWYIFKNLILKMASYDGYSDYDSFEPEQSPSKRMGGVLNPDLIDGTRPKGKSMSRGEAIAYIADMTCAGSGRATR